MRVKIKELGDIITGNTPSKKNLEFWDSNDICFVKPDIIADGCITAIEKSNEYISETARSKARVVKKDTIFVTCIGSIGKIGIAEEGEYAFNQQINAVVPNSKINARYLAYAILYSKPQLAAIANSAVVPIINKSQFGDFEINITEDIKKQEEIVNILDRTNGIIESRQQELQKLDELIKARFVEMFGIPGTDEFGWGLSSLGKCCELNPKKAMDSRLSSGLELSFVPMPAVSENGAIDPSDTRTYDEVKTGFTYFAENDVLFAKITPCMENGKGAVAVGLTNGIGFGSTEFHVMRPIQGVSNPYWLYVLSVFRTFRKDAEANMTGSAGQRRVPASFLDNYKVALPPYEFQEQFATFVKQVDKSKVMKPRDLLVS